MIVKVVERGAILGPFPIRRYHAGATFYTRSPGEKEGGKREKRKERKGKRERKKERERENMMNKLAIESIACFLVDASKDATTCL